MYSTLIPYVQYDVRARVVDAGHDPAIKFHKAWWPVHFLERNDLKLLV
jgi:hypothetical protein